MVNARRGRALVAPRRVARRGARCRAAAFRGAPGPLAELRPAARRRPPVLRAHDRSAAAVARPHRPVPRAGQGRAPRAPGRRRDAGEPRRARAAAPADPRVAALRDPPFPGAERRPGAAQVPGRARRRATEPRHVRAAAHRRGCARARGRRETTSSTGGSRSTTTPSGAGSTSGELAEDTRARDRLQALVAGTTAPEPPSPTLAEDVAFAVEAQAMLEHDGWVKLAGPRRAPRAGDRRARAIRGARWRLTARRAAPGHPVRSTDVRPRVPAGAGRRRDTR